MASTSDTTSLVQKWKESLAELIFPDFDQKLVKEEHLGSGLYGDTTSLTYNGVSYAAKKINISIFSMDDFRQKFVPGCLQLSKLRHPHIAQFLGVHIMDTFTPPTLFMELYPLSLKTCFQRYPEIPDFSKYSVMAEVSLGLAYLHHLPVPVVHGHLNPNNILLTEGLHVKIADAVNFGLETSTPSNYPYQPPEEKPAEAGDIFCLGDVILHVVLQKEVSPLEYKHHRNPENVNEPVILTEVKRRERFLNEVEDSHQLKDLILKCLNEDPEKRPKIDNVSKDLGKQLKEQKPEYENVLDMFLALGQLSLIREKVSGMTISMEAKEEEIEAVKMQMEPLKLEVHSKEEVLASIKEEMEGYKVALQSKEGRVKAHETGLRAKDALIKAKDREILAKKQVLASKESLLKSANKRIEFLEKQVKSSRKGAPNSLSVPGSSPDVKYRESTSVQSSPDSLKSEGGGSRNLKRWSSPFGSDEGGLLLKSNSINKATSQTDPRLAKILARQHQRLDEAEDTEKKTVENGEERDRPVMRRSKTLDRTTPELRRILEKRKSFTEDM